MTNQSNDLQSLRDRIAAIDCYTAQGARDAGLHFADISTEHVRAFQDHVLGMIDAALEGKTSPTAGDAFHEFVRAYGLSRATVIAWATGLPPQAADAMEARMGKVIPFTGVTKLDLPPDRILDGALGRLTTVLILGWDKSGEEYFASSAADGGTCLWLMERLKKQLLEVEPK